MGVRLIVFGIDNDGNALYPPEINDIFKALEDYWLSAC